MACSMLTPISNSMDGSYAASHLTPSISKPVLHGCTSASSGIGNEAMQYQSTRVPSVLTGTVIGEKMEHTLSRNKQEQQHQVDRERFRSVMGNFASGVTIITTRNAGIDYGLTAS